MGALIIAVAAGGACLLSITWKRELAQTAPLWLMVTVAILYAAGLAGWLEVGVVIVCGLAAAGWVLLAHRIYRKKWRQDIKRYLTGPALLLWVGFFLLIWIGNNGRSFAQWDDYSHWGVMLKETLRLDGFYSQAASSLAIHKDYPPAMTLLEYLWCKLCGGYSEDTALRALQFFTVTMLLPVLRNRNPGKRRISAYIIAVLLPAALWVIYIGQPATIYVDFTLAVMGGYGMSLSLRETDWDGFAAAQLSAVSAMLVLTKQMGVFFVGGMLLILILRSGIIAGIGRKRNSADGPKRVLGCALAVIAVTLMAMKSWSWQLAADGVSGGQFNTETLSLSGLITVARGGGEPYRQEVWSRFFAAMTTQPLAVQPFPIAYAQMTALFTAAFAGLTWVFRKTKHKWSLAIGTATVPLLALGYAFVMLLLYLFSFSQTEALGLASYDRYMSTLWIAVVVCLCVVGAETIADWEGTTSGKRQLTPMIAAGGIVAAVAGVLIASVLTYSGKWREFERDNVFAAQKQAAKTLTDIGGRIYLIYQGSNGAEYWGMRYYLNPAATNTGNDWSIGSPLSESDIWTKPETAQTWADKLMRGGYTHVYLGQVNDGFRQEFALLFPPDDPITQGGLYRVEVKQEGLGLVPIV